MNPSDGHAVSLGRRFSTRRSVRSMDSVRSDDEYDLNAQTVSDGFRPVQAAATLVQSPVTSPISLPPPVATVLPVDRPSSTSKPSPAHDSLTLRNDGSSAARQPLSGSHAAPSAMSNASPLIQVETPYRGPTGPSHPYEMYPQRTFSNASASTAPNVDRQSYHGPTGPTHPYSLYTQNTAPAEESSPQQQIPVGFTGLGASYQPQFGPGGEGGDLIGPLGHVEELPPYTRYPETSFAGKAAEPVERAPSPPVETIPGAGGIGIATRNPEFSSAEDDIAVPISRPPSRSDVSHHEINAAAKEVSEQPKLTKWQRRARQKLWGVVPYWAICLLLSGIVIMGIVMGAVIGTLLANHGNPDPPPDGQFDHQPTGTPTDTLPMSSLPPNLAPLETGHFSLPPLDTSLAPKSCFSDPTQAQAWSCDLPFQFYSMDVSMVPKAPDTSNYELTLTAVNSSSTKCIWGTQPPNIPDPKSLQLVMDTFQEARGPAWWAKVKYNKTVIVPEDKFPAPKTKRDWHLLLERNMPGPPPRSRKSFGAKDGDKPWICIWPDTTLEIFIYPNQTASVSTSSSNGPPPPPPPFGSSTTMASDSASPTPEMPLNRIPAYPKVVKLVERRYDDPNTTPVCHQVEIIDNGHGTRDLLDASGRPIEVVIPESNAGPLNQLSQREHIRSNKRQYASVEVQELTSCGCLWWST